MTALRRRIARRLRDEQGQASIEFVIIFPLFVMVMLVGIEAGMMLARHAMLERAVDISVRNLRLGHWPEPTHKQLRDEICTHTTIIPDCRSNLLLELVPVDTASWQMPAQPPACVDRAEEIEPVTDFVEGAGNQIMLVRACVVIDPFFPTTPLGLQLPLDASGGFQMVSLASFVNEPR